jgi:hypothetical protein
MPDVASLVNKLSTAPESRKEFDSWVELKDAVPFLRDNVNRDQIILDVSANGAFMHATVVPISNVDPPDIEDLMSWDLSAWSSWGIDVHYSRGKAKSISISEPLDGSSRCKSFRHGERLVFPRVFDGRQDDKHYREILQKFAHVFDLHFVQERHAYCRLDKDGDVEEVVRIIEIPGRGGRWGTTVVTFNRDILDQYLAMTNSVLLMAFDFTRTDPRGFGGWRDVGHEEKVAENDFFYRSHVEPGQASYMRGIQIVRSGVTKEALIAMHDRPVAEPREYASFIAWDFKDKIIREISTAPDAIANYFTKSELPFEMSPAFFKPEVLLKYKSNLEKYRLEDRSISCRNAWSLETYDINEAGQVHTYLIYLQRLPYDEQLYWKSYNEKPKGSISERALTTDFVGDWYTGYDALASLKEFVRQLDRLQVPWWTLRSEQLLARVHYPVTTSPDEWSNEILNLDQLLIEGFETKWLRKTANELGRNPDAKYQSLKLIEECLMALGFEEAHARSITAPLHNLHSLRTKLKGHAPGEDAPNIRKEAIAQHGSYGKHFRALCGECDEGVRTIAEQFKGMK